MMERLHDPENTKRELHAVVEEMYDRIVKGEPPTMTLPVRTKNNIGFDDKLGVYKYGKRDPLETLRVLEVPKICFEHCTLLNL